MEPPTLSVVLPLYDEAHCLRANVRVVLDTLRAAGKPFELLLVDDGSTDATRRLANAVAEREPEVVALGYSDNRGKGHAVRRGVLRSRGERVLFLDADLSSPASELPKLTRALDAGADIAIGSRALAQSRLVQRQPALREALGRLGNLTLRLFVPSLRGLRDTQCGFKLFRGDVARSLFEGSRIDRWGFDFEVLSLARRRGYLVVEVPVSWQHDPHSKVRLRDYLGTLGELTRLRARELFERPARRQG